MNANNTRGIRHVCIEAFLLLFIFFGFRDISVLCDTSHYYSSLRDKIDYASTIPWFYFNPLERFEPGYQIFETIHAKSFSNPYSIIISSSLIISIGNIYFFRKLNDAGLLLCLFLFLNFQMINQYSAIRQGIATVILYYALLNLIEQNYKRYIFASVLALSFHFTAIIAFGLFPLKYIRFNRKIIIILIVTFIIVSKFLLMPLVSFFASDDRYLNANEDRGSFPLASLILFSMMTYLFISARYYYIRYRKVEIKDLIWLFGLLCLFLQALDIVFPVAGRFTMYLAPFLISVYVSCLRSIPILKTKQKVTLLTFCIFYGWFIIYNIIKPEWFYLYPYSFMDMDHVFSGYEIER